MDDFYFVGFVIAFTIGAIKLVMTTSALFSVRTRNMRQIGLHYALTTATYVPEKSGTWSFVGFAVYQLALAPAASWLSVISVLLSWMRWRSNQASTPEELKRLQYRVANIAMTKQQMIAWQEEISKVLGIAGPVRTGAGDDQRPLVLVLEPGGWYRELRMQPDRRTLEFYGHTPDYDGIFHSRYEYRFDGEDLMTRLLEDESDHYGKKDWAVQDGVVLEEGIRQRATGLLSHRVDQRIAEYRSAVSWHRYHDPRVRFFAMTMHPAQFSHARINEVIRGEIQRVRTAVESTAMEARQLGFDVVENDDGLELKFGADWSEAQKQAASDHLSAVCERLGTNYVEIGAYKKRKLELLKIVGG